MKRFSSFLLVCVLLIGFSVEAFADREVKQLQFGKQTITVAEDETIMFVDPKGDTNYSGQNSENAQSLTVFKSGKEGMSVQITFESMNMGGSGSYYSVANVYNGNPDADDSFTWATTTTGTGGVPTSYSTSVLPSGDILRAYPNEKGKTYTNETYFSTASDGSLSVGFAYRYAYSCTGWTAKVKLVKLENMTVKSAASSYDAVLESPKSRQNVTFAAINVTTEGAMNADKLTSVSFTLPTNESAIDATALRLVDASGNNLNATITEASGVYTMTAESTLSEGVNTYYIKGDFLGTASVGAKVKVVPTKVTTTANPTGVASFTQAEAKTISVPAIVIMSSTSQTVTVGDTPLSFYDEGGIDGQVCQNANGQVTFLPATSGKKIMVDFTKLKIWKGSLYVQEIRIYNGTEVKADNLLKTLNDGETGVVRSTSADGALTVQLFSNTTSTYSSYDGWEATVSQFTPQPMTVETLETAAASTATVSAGDVAEMLKIEILTENTEPALIPQSFSFTTNGTNALISKAAVYSTGTSATFATTKKIGEVDVTADNIVVNITDAKALVEGNNYFWLGYTVSSTAKNDQKISAKLQSIAFTNSTTSNYAGEVKAERTVKNIAIATEGTKTVMVDGSFGIQSEQYGANPTNYSAPGTTDRIVVFKPANTGNVCQVEFSDMEVYYSSSSYGSKCKFVVYSGEGTSGTKLLEVTAPTSGSYYKTTGQVLRSTSADGALTIVYNPNTTSYYYCGKGFTGLVSEYLTQDQKVDEITVAQSSTAAVSVGGKKQAMLDLNLKMIGTANPIKLSQLNVNLKGTEASVDKVELYQGETLLGSANAAEGDFAITLTEPASLNEGNNAFKLYVDVKADAEADATVDLKAVSAVVGGKTETIANGDPEGSRVVKYMYLIASGDNGTMTISDKTVMFYDDGGADNNSARDFTGNITFKPASEGKAIKLTFKALKLGAYSDKMNVSDGSAVKTTADKAYGYYDTSSPYGYDTTLPGEYVSKAADGSLTVQWITGTSTTTVSNFAIEVSCYEKVPLAVTKITTTAGETTEVLKSSEGVVMQKIAVTVEGDKDNVAISNINVTAAETTALGTAKVYATGTANAFAANNLVGQSTAAGDIAVDYNITAAGTYYFWLTYDVPSTVSVGDKASASVASVTANGNVISVASPTTAQVAVISGKSGTYTVGAGGDYATIQAAINSLAIGVEGPVVLSIKPGTYNEKLMIPAIKGASSTNTVTIKGAGEKRGNVKIYHNQYSSPAYGEAGYGVITFENANYVTLKNLSVSTEDPTFKAVVYVRNASRHITVDGCYLSAPLSTSYSGGDINVIGHLVDNSKDADGNYLQNNNNDYLTVKNNVIEGGYIGINMGGTSYVALPKEVGGVIENNIVRGQGSKAIYVMDELGAKIKNNIVYNVEATASSFCGLDMQVRDEYTESTEVSGNTFYLANSNTATGMSLRQLTGTDSAPVVIDHNEVRVISKYAATTGVKFGNANISNVNFHHNSIRITQAETPVSTGGKALWISSAVTGSNFTVDSNIAQGETGDYAVNIYKDTNAAAVTFKNNALYTNGTTFGYPSAVASYNEWKTLTGEADGINQNVAFKDDFRLFPAAEAGDRGAHPYDASQAAATKALGDPSADEAWGTPEPEVSTPILTLAENESNVALGDSYDLYVTLEDGTAPYTLTITAGNTVVKTETLTETPEDILAYELTPTECTEYVVTVVDANEKKASDVIRLITTGNPVVATFENLPLESESSFSGIYELEDEEDYMRESTFVNGSYSFYQGTMPDYDTWWGIGYANHAGTSFSALADQFKNCVGGGYKSSQNYAVAYYMAYMGSDCAPSVTVLNNEDGDVVPGMYVTNTAYALNSMQNGDSYAKKFGYGDWFKLTATGYDKDGNQTNTADFYLADMRADNTEDRYIVTDWRYMDLSVLGKVKKIVFTMSSSDNSAGGMNTPAYFAFDNFGANPNETVAVSQYGYATYTPKNAVVIPEGVEVYYVESNAVNDGKVAITKYEGTTLAAGEGVILKATQGSYVFEAVTTETVEAIDGNLMVGYDYSTPANNHLAANSAYILAAQGGKAVFSLCSEGDLAVGKAYLPATVSSGAATLMFVFDDDATDINEVTTQNSKLKTENSYNLQGQKVDENFRGIVIKNGKKFKAGSKN